MCRIVRGTLFLLTSALLLLPTTLFLPSSCSSLLPCAVAEYTLLATPGSPYTLNASCSSAVLRHVTLQASTLVLSIGDMVLGNLAAPTVGIDFVNLTLLDGAVLIINATPSYVPSDIRGGPKVSIAVSGVNGRDSSMAVTGAFPPLTRIFIENVEINVVNNTRLEKFAMFNLLRQPIFLLAHVSLREGSKLIISGFAANVSSATWVSPIVGTGTVAVTGASSLVVAGVAVHSMNESLYFRRTILTVMAGSELVVSNGIFHSVTSFPVSIDASAISIGLMSSWRMHDLVLQSDSPDGHDAAFLGSTGVAVFSNSSWRIERVNLKPKTGAGFQFQFCKNVTVSDGSEIVFAVVSVGLGARTLFAIQSQIFLRHWSQMRFDQCPSGAVGFFGCNTTLQRGSSLLITESQFMSNDDKNGSPLAFSAQGDNPSLLLVGNGSAFVLRKVHLTAAMTALVAPAVYFDSTDVEISGGSSFVIDDSVLTSPGQSIIPFIQLTAAFLLFNARFTVRASSEVRITHTNLASEFSAAVQLGLNSQVLVKDLSLWSFEGGSWTGYSGAMASDASCLIIVQGSSAMVVAGVAIASTGGASASAVVSLESKLTVGSDSLFVVHGNRMLQQSPAFSCMDLGRFQLRGFGMVRVTDNECAVPPSEITAMQPPPFMTGYDEMVEDMTCFPQLVVRCNRVNGAVWADNDGLLRQAIPGLLHVPCGRCDALIDCFSALTEVTAFSKLRCQVQSTQEEQMSVSGMAECPCVTECGGSGRMCLPGLGTAATDSDSTRMAASGCVDFHNGRLRLSASASATATATETKATSSPSHQLPEFALFGTSALRQSSVVATALTALGGGSSTSMLQRALAQDRINRCGSDESEDEVDFSSSPTQMAVGNGEALLRRVRGTVVGNVLLVGCLATAGFAAGKVLHLRGVSRTMREAEAELGLPGKVWMPLSMLFVPTLSAAVSLLAGNNRSTTDASDVVVALFGMVLCGTALLGALWLTTGSRFKARAVHSDAAREFGTAAKRFTFREASLHGFRHWMIYQLSGQWEWVDRREPLFVDRWGELFDGNIRGRHWFISVDIAASILTALLAGLTAAENASCGTLQVLSVIFDVGYFVCLYNLRPYSAPHDTALALGNAAATCCSSLLGVFGVDTSAVTAAQAAINVISIAVGFAALAAEGRAVAFVDRFVLVVQAVGRRLPLRSRRGRGHGGFSTASHAGQPLDLPEQCRLLEQLVTTYVQRRAHHTTGDLDISGSLEKMVRVICSDVTLRRRAEEPIA